MFASPVPSSAPLSTAGSVAAAAATAPVAAVPQSRPSRLRGLSYLRSYTQAHLSSSHNPPASPTSPSLLAHRGSAATSPAPQDAPASGRTTPSTQANSSSVAGYFSRVIKSSDPARGLPAAAAAAADDGGPAIGTAISTDDAAEDSRGMARKRAGSGQAGQAARRGQSVPSAGPGADSRAYGRLTRTVSSSNEAVAAPPLPTIAAAPGATLADGPTGLSGLPQDQMPTIRFIPHQDPRSTKPSLAFSATSRTLPHEDCVIRVGRYSDRDMNHNPPANVPSAAPVGFKSKVVSRRHCEFWCSQGQWYIKDVKSSSGTFLNHIRLSQPSVESRPFPVNDGDVVQLGIDFKGGEEQIFRCVKIRIECNRAWQKGLNSFNMSTHKRLRALANSAVKKDSDTASTHSSECAICLMPVSPCQSLFVAPCSHVWHYKCIRPILNDHKVYPQFLCPNCRAVADLEADVDEPMEQWDELEAEDEAGDTRMHDSIDERRPAGAAAVDEDLATASGQLSLEAAAAAASSSPPPPSPPQPSVLPTTASLLSRRIAAQIAPGSETLHGSGDAMDLSETSGPDTTIPLPQHDGASLRPATPFAPEDALVPEGPLTPRNDAGPFVFDGSAGRAVAINGHEHIIIE